MKTAGDCARIALRNAERAVWEGHMPLLHKECAEWRADGVRMGAGQPPQNWHAETARAHAWRAVIAARNVRAYGWSYNDENAAWRAALWAAKCAGYEEAAE